MHWLSARDQGDPLHVEPGNPYLNRSVTRYPALPLRTPVHTGHGRRERTRPGPTEGGREGALCDCRPLPVQHPASGPCRHPVARTVLPCSGRAGRSGQIPTSFTGPEVRGVPTVVLQTPPGSLRTRARSVRRPAPQRRQHQRRPTNTGAACDGVPLAATRLPVDVPATGQGSMTASSRGRPGRPHTRRYTSIGEETFLRSGSRIFSTRTFSLLRT